MSATFTTSRIHNLSRLSALHAPQTTVAVVVTVYPELFTFSLDLLHRYITSSRLYRYTDTEKNACNGLDKITLIEKYSPQRDNKSRNGASLHIYEMNYYQAWPGPPPRK